MDRLNAAASVVALVQICGTIFILCQDYSANVKHAREVIRRLRDEVVPLQDILTEVVDLAEAPGSAKLAVLHRLSEPDGLVQQCQSELEMLCAKLDTAQSDGNMTKLGLRALKWPFSKTEIEATLFIIRRQKEQFHLALAADTA